jgi:hypothetical protein
VSAVPLDGTEKCPCAEFAELMRRLGSSKEKTLEKMPTHRNEVTALEYFAGGVPPFVSLKLELDRTDGLVGASEKKFQQKAAEIGLISLCAYFEAFCKDLFGAAANICPHLLANFAARRTQVSIELDELMNVVDKVEIKLGHLLAEKYDFGSAKAINGLYFDLLAITPFSKTDSKKYSYLLNDRNLLVHHGGIYTIKYAKQKFDKQDVARMAHWDSVVVSEESYLKWSSFIRRVATKMAFAGHRALEKLGSAQGVILNEEQKKAIWYLAWKD